MAKVTEYPRITKMKDNDILLVDGPDGTRTILQTDASKQMGGEVIMVNETAGDSTKVVINTTNEDIELATMADLEPVEEDVGELKTQITNINNIIGSEPEVIDDLSGYTQYSGNISDSNTWNNINENYKHIVIPITRHPATISLTGGITASTIAAVKTYSEPVSGVAPDFSADPEWTVKRKIPAGEPRGPYTLPLDANHLIVMMMKEGTTNCVPAVFNLVLGESDGLIENVSELNEKMDSVETNMQEIAVSVSDLDSQFEDIIVGEPAIVVDISDLSEYTQYNGNISTSTTQGTYGDWVNISDNYKHIYIPFSRNTGGTVSFKANSGSASVIAFVKNYVTPVSGERPHYSDENGFNDVITVPKGNPGYYNIPSDCYGVILMVKINDTIKTPSEFTLTVPKGTGTLTAQTDENTNDIDVLQKLVEADYYDRSSLDGLTATNGNLGDSGNWCEAQLKLKSVPPGHLSFKIAAKDTSA